MQKKLIISGFILGSLFFSNKINAQSGTEKMLFTHADTLRGSNGIFRQQWDVLHYNITVEPDYVSKTISAKNTMQFFDNGAKIMQIDLQQPMILDSVKEGETSFKFTRENNVYWLEYRDTANNIMYKIKPSIRSLTFYYHGKPKEAVRAPWDGGWV